MLIPYKDENPTSRFPVITVVLILLNIAVFLYQIFGKLGFANITIQYGLIPAEIFQARNLENSNMVNPYFTLITFMFLHGGFLHLLFNMLFLWIFGNNVEDRMSAIKFTIFYLLTGIISGVAFALISPTMNFPLIGASGAISGILGAYLIMYPFARIRVIFIIFRIRMPAMIFIVIWFVTQIFGILNTGTGNNNIAWAAHVFGFIAGIVLFKLFTVKRPRKEVTIIRY